MEPKTQSAGSLQPPGRVPPTAIGTATPVPPPGPRPASYRTGGSRIGYWVVNIAPMPVFLVSATLAATTPSGTTRVAGLVVAAVSLLAIGVMMGLGRYRVGPSAGFRLPHYHGEPSRKDVLKKYGRPDGRAA